MAFQEVNLQLQYKKFALWEKGNFLQGKFIKLKESGEYKGNMQYQAIIELTEDANFDDYKDQPILKGSKFGLALSTAILDYFTEDMVGNLFQITYNGKVPNKSGDNQYHDFKILMDDSSSTSAAPSSEEDDLEL